MWKTIVEPKIDDSDLELPEDDISKPTSSLGELKSPIEE